MDIKVRVFQDFKDEKIMENYNDFLWGLQNAQGCIHAGLEILNKYSTSAPEHQDNLSQWEAPG